MRKFALYRINQAGALECLPLNGPHFYLTSPDGLGIDFNPELASFGDSFFQTIRTSSFSERIVSGELIIYDEQTPKNVYHYYQVFLNWCIEAKELFFGYDPLGSDTESEFTDHIAEFTGTGLIWSPVWDDLIEFRTEESSSYVSISGGDIVTSNRMTAYRCDVKFGGISKTEMDVYGTLRCDVNFKMLTPWYDNLQEALSTSTDLAYFVHTLSTPIRGHVDGGVHFTVEGTQLVQPQFYLYDVDPNEPDAAVQLMHWGDSKPEHQYNDFKLEFSSRYGQCSYTTSGDVLKTEYVPARKESVDIDWVQKQNVSKDIFGRIPKGHSLRIVVIAQNVSPTQPITIYAKQFDYFLGV